MTIIKIECSICNRISTQTNSGKRIYEDIYEQIFPEIPKLNEYMKNIEECTNCGFVFTSISENLSKATAELVSSTEYKELNKDGCQNYIKAYKVGMICECEGIYKMASRFYMYAGILSTDKTYKNVSLKKAFICMSKYHNEYDMWRTILFIEILRLNEMYRVAAFECENLYYKKLNSLQRGIVLSLEKLVEEKNSDYYDYYEMLKRSNEI